MSDMKCQLKGIQVELIQKDKQEVQAIGKVYFHPLLLCN